MDNARALLARCDRSLWQRTLSPDGRWVRRTAESVVFTDCPPGPDERKLSHFKSVGMSMGAPALLPSPELE
jgi:hypothetical protein